MPLRDFPSTKKVIFESGKTSLQRLQTDCVRDTWRSRLLTHLTNGIQVDVYYLHAPDPRVPLQDTLSGINELHQQGAFKRFGLSNFPAHQVEDIVAIAKESGFILPSVYQGNYNAFFTALTF